MSTETKDMPIGRYVDLWDKVDKVNTPVCVKIGPYEVTRVTTRHRPIYFQGNDVFLKADLPERFRGGSPFGTPEMLRREFDVMSSLNSPHCCRPRDYLAHVGPIGGIEDLGVRDYLVMERVPGKCLDDLLGKGGLPAPVAVKLLKDVAKALITLHRQGILYRDLKPGNVMVTPKNSAVLVDFGTALPSDKPPWFLSWGTIQYMSPQEEFKMMPEPGDDSWGFAALAVSALTGRPPFNKKYEVSGPLFTQRCVGTDFSSPTFDEYNFRRDYNGLGKTILRGFSANPDERPRMATYFMALDACLRKMTYSGSSPHRPC